MTSQPTSRRRFLHTAGMGVAAAGLGCREQATLPENPNVLIIICDDLNDSIEGMGGHPQARTPNIRRLIDSGVQFTNAQTNCPLCGPSRASVWSGIYPHASGYFGKNQQANRWRRNPVLEECVTLPEHFRTNGYNVAATGKIHHNGHEDWSIFSEFGPKPSFGPYPWDGKSVNARGRKEWMSHPSMPPPLHPGHWEDSFGPLDEIPKYPGHEGWVLYNEPFEYRSDEDRTQMPDEQSAAWASEWLAAERADPFLMMVGFSRPHTPLYAPRKYFEMFPLTEIQLPPYLSGDIEDCAPELWRGPRRRKRTQYGFGRYDRVLKAGGPEMWRRWIQAYLACVAFVDDQVGTVLDALEASPHRDNTIAVFTGDHGYHMGEKDYLFKNSVWEESCRVPFVVRAPGLTPAGETCTHPISLVDLYPTLSDLCGLPAEPNAAGNGQALGGYSLRPFLEEPAAGGWGGPPVALTALAGPDRVAQNQPAPPGRQHYSVRSRRFRYVLGSEGGEELYDHEADPNEWHNLAGEPEHSEIRQQLRAEIARMTGREMG